MYRITILTCLLAFITGCKKDEILSNEFYNCQDAPTGNSHPGSIKYEALLEDVVNSGVPGMMLSVHDNRFGYWSGAKGWADLASEVPLRPCQQTRVGSTVKTFTAVTMLLLQEQGLLDLDDLISKYLPGDDIKGLENADQSTIRQLLWHSSGIYNYILNLQFQTASLNDLIKEWKPEELLGYARNKPAYFPPGSDVKYSNTNYILLGMIIEKITGKPFYEVFDELIFQPLGLTSTQFAASDPVPNGIIRGYVDLYSNQNLINATYYSGWDYYTADGGLISNALDLSVFMTQLFQGSLLKEESLREMITWKAPETDYGNGFETFYGLGIFRLETEFGPAYLHSGDAIGYFASMAYFPEHQVTITWAVNANYGKIDQFTQSKKAMEKIFRAVLAE